ncbi:MAG: ABC transporter ATP-binding protein [Bacillota bacterium]
MNWAVVAEKLFKRYQALEAVKGISFRIGSHECYGFLGPNGAGKTTTLKMIYGFSPLTAGKLLVLGMDVTAELRSIKARIGVVPQEDNLDPELTVLENLLMFSSYFGISKEEALGRAPRLLQFVEIEDRANTPVEELSGGLKRRLTIARALVNQPEVLLLDEPTTGLDPQARRLIWDRLLHLKQEGVTIILTTHYMEEAHRLCDRIAMMDLGEILAEGPPDQLVSLHAGREVLELGGAAKQREAIEKTLEGLYSHSLVVGESLFLYSNNGKELWYRLQQANGMISHQLLRPTNLEDVFLKLTGRGLD